MRLLIVTYLCCSLVDLALVVDNSEERLVVLVLSLIHAGFTTKFLISHLSVQELGILRVDTLNFERKTGLLILSHRLVLLPHDGLLVIQSLLPLLPLLLLRHLTAEIRAHLCLLPLPELQPFFILSTHSHLPLDFIFVDVVVLLLLAGILTANHGGGHPVHKLLGTSLTTFEFVVTVSGLLVQHGGVVLLGLDVFDTLTLEDFVLLSLVSCVFLHHLLQIELFLVALVEKHLTFGVHLGFQAKDQVLVLLVVGLLLDLLALLVKFELAVP